MIFFLVASFLPGCGINQKPTAFPESSAVPQSLPLPPTPPLQQPSPTLDMAEYVFPGSVDPLEHFIFYQHGRIIEDQWIIPALEWAGYQKGR
jgi:hypothetical protein